MEPLIEIPYKISRAFIHIHPEWIFLYGNDLYNKGCLGQAWFASGESNAFKVTTCRRICNNSSAKFFFNDHLEEYKEILARDWSNIPFDDRPIIPFPKIGQGCSNLKEGAPLLFKYLQECLSKIVYPNFIYNYKWNSHERLTI